MYHDSISWFETVREITKTLVAIPSVSPDGEAENRCAEAIFDILSEPFTEAGDSPGLKPVFWETGDGRKNVACLLKSSHANNTGKTIILMGHFDTVGVDDFARFGDSAIAFHPEELAKAIRRSLEGKQREASEVSAYEALQSGEWMFGRGSVDMKSGVAVIIKVFREFARLQTNGKRRIDDLNGNLLFLACPDEETESAGILSAVPKLIHLRDQEKLSYLGVINTDYTAPRGADENDRFIYSGTVGKLLPSFYILGVRTHVGEIFRGVDAAHIAAELVSRINLNPEWIDSWKGTLGGVEVSEVAPPPVALYIRDLKPSYNVETAGDAFVYVNWLTLTLTPGQALQKMKDAASAALEAVYAQIDSAYAQFAARGGQAQPPPDRTGYILNYELVHHEAQRRWEADNKGGNFSKWLSARTEEFAASAKDGRDLSRMIVAELARVAQINGPAIITFISPPYYPSVKPQETGITRAVREVLKGVQEPVQLRGYYPYISDLSYVRLNDGMQIESLKKDMPLFDVQSDGGKFHYPLDSGKLDDVRLLNCPVINIGPFGMDAHGLYERVQEQYSFQTVPQLIYETIIESLK